jgi:hypothetical protein
MHQQTCAPEPAGGVHNPSTNKGKGRGRMAAGKLKKRYASNFATNCVIDTIPTAKPMFSWMWNSALQRAIMCDIKRRVGGGSGAVGGGGPGVGGRVHPHHCF